MNRYIGTSDTDAYILSKYIRVPVCLLSCSFKSIYRSPALKYLFAVPVLVSALSHSHHHS